MNTAVRFDYDSQEALNHEYDTLAAKERLLPIKVPPFYLKKVEEEVSALGAHVGPLHRAVFPTKEKLSLHAPGEVSDFVDDRSNMPKGLATVVIRKYHERLLFLPTTKCVGHCQYCFRQDVLSETNSKSQTPQLTDRLVGLSGYIREHPEIVEVILSGGDPMGLSLKHISLILEHIHSANPSLAIRIHSRTLAFAPEIYTIDKLKLLGHHRIRLVSHFIHPYEVCDLVRTKLKELSSAGVRLYNQFPLLRGVNDHPHVLAKLLHILDDNGVRTLSMFIPDAIHYSASFRIRLQRLWQIIDQLNWSTPSWINSVRTVLDSHIGKVRREDLVRYDESRNVAIFARNGKEVEYPDLPAEMDTPGDIKVLLWRDRT